MGCQRSSRSTHSDDRCEAQSTFGKHKCTARALTSWRSCLCNFTHLTNYRFRTHTTFLSRTPCSITMWLSQHFKLTLRRSCRLCSASPSSSQTKMPAHHPSKRKCTVSVLTWRHSCRLSSASSSSLAFIWLRMRLNSSCSSRQKQQKLGQLIIRGTHLVAHEAQLIQVCIRQQTATYK